MHADAESMERRAQTMRVTSSAANGREYEPIAFRYALRPSSDAWLSCGIRAIVNCPPVLSAPCCVYL